MRLESLPLDEILPPEKDLRSWIEAEGLEDLAESIKARGVLQPLRVLKRKKGHEIQDGHRRYLAAQKADLVNVPCLILEEDDSDSEINKIITNLYKEDVSPLDQAKHLHYLQDNYGFSRDALAKLMGVGLSRVNQIMTLVNLDPQIQEALADKRIGERAARHLNQVPDESERHYLLNYAINGGATVQTIENWARSAKYRSEFAQSPAATPDTGHKPEEQGPLRQQCKVCNKHHDPNTMLSIQVCFPCHPMALSMFKSIREASQIEEEQGE